jgi:hypothetical protein
MKLKAGKIKLDACEVFFRYRVHPKSILKIYVKEVRSGNLHLRQRKKPGMDDLISVFVSG